MPVFYIYPKSGDSWQADVGKDRVSLGRARTTDVIIHDRHCSSCHAVVERAGGVFVIRDAGSKNGTIVNDRRIKGPTVLAPGDEITLGSTTVVFERPRMRRVRLSDHPSTSHDATASVPFRTILERTSAAAAGAQPGLGPRELREENWILQVVIRVSEALIAHKPVQELLEDLLELVARYVPMDQCVIMLRGPGGSGLEARAVRAQEDWRRGGDIEVSRRIVSMAYERHLSVLMTDPGTDSRFPDAGSIIAKNIRSALCVPIGDEEGVIGVLYADRHGAAEPFSDTDLRMATLLANTAAVRLQQARQVAELLKAERVRRELAIAAEIQRDFLPHALPRCPGYDFAGRALPCLQVGGDYYDLIPMDGERFGLAIADVSGKGIGAALLMATLRAWLRAELRHGTDLAATAAKLNDFIYESSDIHSFITFFLAELDAATGLLWFVNAGHNPPLLFGAGGSVEELPPTGMALGMLAEQSYAVGRAKMKPDEVLVLYTDGITESRSAANLEFGPERLAGLVHGARAGDATSILETVLHGLGEFTGCLEAVDDRTLVVVKRGPFESAPRL